MSAPTPQGNRTRWLGMALGAGAALTVIGVLVATTVVEREVRARLGRIADGAGLQLQLDDVSVSVFGTVSLSGMHLRRADGSDMLALPVVDASLSPLRALAGRRRPESLALEGLRLDVRLRDGRPEELLDLLRALRTVLRRAPDADREDRDADGAGARAMALHLRDGEVAIRLEGQFADLLPGGVRVRGIEVGLDAAAGIGSARAHVEGAATSVLSAQVVPTVADGDAMRVRGGFTPPLALPLPPLPGLAELADAVVIRGLTWDAKAGPALDGVSLHKGAQLRLDLGAIAVDPSEGVRIGPLRAEPALLGALQVVAQNPGLASGAAAKAPAVKAPAVKAPAKPPAAPVVAGPSAAFGAATLKALTLSPTEVGGWRVDLDSGALPLPLGLGTIEMSSASIEFGSAVGADGGAGAAAATTAKPLQRPITVTIEQVRAKIQWSRETISALPNGAALWDAIEKARAKPVIAAATEEEDDEVDRPELAPEARRKAPQSPRKAPRKGPASAAAIPALQDLLAAVTAVDGRVASALARLDALPGLTFQLENGGVDLLEPAAALPSFGLRAAKAALTAQLGDGSRGLDAGVELFGIGSPDAVGVLKAKVATTAHGRFDAATFTFSGGAVAMAARGLGAAIHVGPGASLDGSLAIRTEAAGQRTRVEGSLDAKGVGVDWWRLAPRPIEGLSFSANLLLVADGEQGSLALDLDPIRVGEATMRVSALVSGLGASTAPDKSVAAGGADAASAKPVRPASGDKAKLRIAVELPRQDCGKIAAALPPSMVPTIGKIEAVGELAADVTLELQLANPYKSDFDANLDDAGCVVTAFGNLDLKELRGEFKRPVNESGTLLEDQQVGPSSDAWVPLAELPGYVPYAMLVTEDGAFYKHRGLRLGLLERAIKMNLDYGRFVYGGSTLTQQLVKNLYLTRDKYLGRKFEELLIVWHMERTLMADPVLPTPDGLPRPTPAPKAPSRAPGRAASVGAEDDDGGDGGEDLDIKVKTKDRILELYVNIVEFAPSKYGVHRAAQVYFGKDPRQLTPLEAAFLAANKPHPRVGYRVFESKKWTPWWQERMISVLRKMREDGVITEEQFIAEAPYVPRFTGWPEPQAPEEAVEGAVGVGGVAE